MEHTKRLKQGAEKLRNIAKRLRALCEADVPKDYRHDRLRLVRIVWLLEKHVNDIDTRFDRELKLRQAEGVRALECAGVWEAIRREGEKNRSNPEDLTDLQVLLGLEGTQYPDIFSEDTYVYDSARFYDYVIPYVAPRIGEPPPVPAGWPPDIPKDRIEHEDNAKVLKLRVQYYADACDMLAEFCDGAAVLMEESSEQTKESHPEQAPADNPGESQGESGRWLTTAEARELYFRTVFEPYWDHPPSREAQKGRLWYHGDKGNIHCVRDGYNHRWYQYDSLMDFLEREKKKAMSEFDQPGFQ